MKGEGTVEARVVFVDCFELHYYVPRINLNYLDGKEILTLLL